MDGYLCLSLSLSFVCLLFVCLFVCLFGLAYVTSLDTSM
jgi:hypothetical protein